MISRIIGTFSSILLGAGFISGICAGAESQAVPAQPSASGAGHTASQPASAKLGDNTPSDSDTARKLSPNDAISVTVYQEDELNTKTIIDKSGMVMLPLLGQVELGGLTIGQGTARIQQLYKKDYLVDPQINLIVEHFAERRFMVLGSVQHPGSFEFPQNESVNLLEAIAISGGYTRLGAPSKVDVRRAVDGVTKIYHFDAGAMAKDSKKKPFEILPGDNITVGERTF